MELQDDNIQAALGLAQLERLDEVIEIKNIGKKYMSFFKNINNIKVAPEKTSYSENILGFGLVLDGKDTVDNKTFRNY